MNHNLPRKTVGHHFSDLLTCPQRAWLHYYGNYHDKVRDPSHLLALQREGLEHEQKIYQTLYPDARKISTRVNSRADETYQAMKAGEPVILQGYVAFENGEGIIDVLEKVGPDPNSTTGYSYRVGEIKRAKTLKTHHVFQTAWYTELLEKVYHQRSLDVFFILGNGQKETIQLAEIWPDYEKAKQQLFQVRDAPNAPGPFLCPLCSSCHWRAVCMPQLIQKQHLSLLPGISRTQAELLKQMGVQTWMAVKELTDANLAQIGFGEFEIEQNRVAGRQLEKGILPLRKALRQNLLAGVRVVVLEFPDLRLQRRSEGLLQPSAICYEGPTGIIHQPVNDLTSDMTAFSGNEPFVFYGKTDLTVFRKLLSQNGVKLKHRPIDLLDMIEKYVHGPLLGLELDVLYHQINGAAGQTRLHGEDRVRAVRQVVDWLGKSLA